MSEQNKELQITPGIAKHVADSAMIGRFSIWAGSSPTAVTTIRNDIPEAEANNNATLYADAHNTYNTCKKLPFALLRERDNLRNFIENIIGKECWNRVEYLDGGDVQDEAERMGILVQVPHAIPCEDELCGCEGEDVDYLYNFAWRVSTLNTEKA